MNGNNGKNFKQQQNFKRWFQNATQRLSKPAWGRGRERDLPRDGAQGVLAPKFHPTPVWAPVLSLQDHLVLSGTISQWELGT